MANIGDLVAYLKANTRDFDTGINRSISKARDFANASGKHFSMVNRHVRSLVRPLTSLQAQLLGLAGVAGLGFVAKGALDVAASFESMEIKLDVLTKGRGRQTLQELNEWALEMPVNTRKAVDTFAMMKALGLDPNIESMQTLVDVSAVMGEDAMPRVARALGQMATLGKLSAEELNQLAEAGINARKYLMDSFGMTVEELQKSGKDINVILKSIMDGMSKEFEGAAVANMKTWSGLWTTMVSYLEEAERMIFDAGIFQAMKDFLSSINDDLQAWIKNNRDLIKIKVPEYLDKITRAAKGAWEFLKFVGEAISTIWKLISAIPKGFLDFLDNMAKKSKEANERMMELNGTLENMKPPDQTTFQRFWTNLSAYGENIVDVFSFMGKAFGEVLAVMASDALATVKYIALQFMNLGTIVTRAMMFDFSGAKAAYDKLGQTNVKFLQEIQVNWEAYEQGIYDSWDAMMKDIEDRFFPAPKAPPQPDLESYYAMRGKIEAPTPDIPEATDWKKYWEDYWKSAKGKEEMKKALADISESAHEDIRLGRVQPDTGINEQIRKLAELSEFQRNMEEFRTRQTIQQNERVVGAYESMFGELKWKADGYYEYRIMQIQMEGQAYFEATKNAVLANQWMNDQLATLNQERTEQWMKDHAILVELSQRTSDAIEQTFSNLIDDALAGKLDTFRDYLSGLGEAFRRVFADIAGQMLKEFLVNQAKSLINLAMQSTQTKKLTVDTTAQATATTGLTAAISLQVPAVSSLAAAYWALAAAKAAAGMGGGTNYGSYSGGIGNMGAFKAYQGGGHFVAGQQMIVGEEGPELVRFGRGGHVFTADQTRAMAGEGGLTINVPISVAGEGGGALAARLQEEIEQTVLDILKEEMR